MKKIVTTNIFPRSEAKLNNQLRYFTGQPCPQGHLAERYTSSGGCVECLYLRGKQPAAIAHSKKWSLSNKERRRAARQRRYADNKEALYEQRKLWNAANRGRLIKYCHDRRARQFNAPGTHTENDRIEIWRKQKRRCALCRESLPFENAHADHIVALTKSGTNEPRNIQMVHKSCNSRKNNKDPIEYAQSIGRLI